MAIKNERTSTYVLHEELQKIAREIDLDKMIDEKPGVTSKVIEEQKTYFWIRLFLNEENNDVRVGDDISITYLPSGEVLNTKFASYGKIGLERNQISQITNFDMEDDKKILTLMVDYKDVNLNEEIPFIRTLFKVGNHYEYQLIRHDELIFEHDGMVLEYYDCDF